VLSIENSRRQLGYEPQYADIRDGLEEYIQQYRQYRKETAHITQLY
jgi:nucleoside-diphosphate-sugar epimerase